VGKANVGKSSLLNALLQRERAIVTEIPGTTRDTLTEWIDIDGFPILLTDTAGLRLSPDLVEKAGQQRTRESVDLADLVLVIFDGYAGITSEDRDIYDMLKEKRKLLLVNKTDLGSVADIRREGLFSVDKPIMISALTGAGLDDLKAQIAHALALDSFNLESALLATERQYDAMKKACDTLKQMASQMENNPASEIISVYLRETLDHLGELVGETTAEDILTSIFGRFCIGK
jgi:tRNA modification GTPase